GELGFSPDQAEVMIRGTFVGALALLEQSGQAPHELREAVTSPQGTTEAALNVYAAADLPSIIRQASAAAIARAQELAGD
ncbi:MAG: pyrroline-5-carboxylate reductase, partial [Microbacteriaceae bacterium]|nr:pyrroline-5-carboxylate reductase [Microbacteriaceae bacterium]